MTDMPKSAMPKLDIDTDYIEKLADIIGRTGLTEIELAQGEIKIRVARQVQMVVEAAARPVAAHEPAAAVAAASPMTTLAGDANHPGLITSPMVGTVYLSPEPSAPAFVSVGDEVREGQTLLIIEAMKVMNAIRAPRGGRVSRIIVQNAAPVEYGEPLLIIE